MPSERDLQVTTSALQRVRDDLNKRRADLDRRRDAVGPSQSSWYKRVVPNFGEDSDYSDAQEIKGLEALEYQMGMNLEELKHTHEQAKFGRTFYGRVFNFGGRIFAVYCVFRILTVSSISLPPRFVADTPIVYLQSPLSCHP